MSNSNSLIYTAAVYKLISNTQFLIERHFCLFEEHAGVLD